MTQAKLAESLSVSRAQLSNYENGKSPPDVNVVTEIAQALKTEFVVCGYRISRNGSAQVPAIPLAEQICFEFGKEHRFPVASVTIHPTKDSILIAAVVARPRS
jgi:transcriptional regulator with XRE-family HTH domain